MRIAGLRLLSLFFCRLRMRKEKKYVNQLFLLAFGDCNVYNSKVEAVKSVGSIENFDFLSFFLLTDF